MPKIVPIVEGHGEVPSLRPLIHLVQAHAESDVPIEVERPIRKPKSQLLREGELERAVQLAMYKCGQDGFILVVIDADEDCAANMGAELEQRARQISQVRLGVALPVREYEAWLMASATSIAGERGLPADLEPPEEPEEIGDAKGWITAHLSGNNVYRETIDQPRLTAALDVDAALQTRSFRKLYKELTNYFEEVANT